MPNFSGAFLDGPRCGFMPHAILRPGIIMYKPLDAPDRTNEGGDGFLPVIGDCIMKIAYSTMKHGQPTKIRIYS